MTLSNTLHIAQYTKFQETLLFTELMALYEMNLIDYAQVIKYADKPTRSNEDN